MGTLAANIISRSDEVIHSRTGRSRCFSFILLTEVLRLPDADTPSETLEPFASKRTLMEQIWTWLQNLEWNRVIPETVGKTAGFLLGFAASWFLLFRRKLLELRRFNQGESDEILFQMHKLMPLADSPDDIVLLFRNVGIKTSINQLYENTAARDLVRKLADSTSITEPILRTEGTPGFEVINDALGHIAGYLSLTPFERENWLFMVTCEDRQVVRKRCIRCFLIRPEDLGRFANLQWCLAHVKVEKPWHAYRVLSLHSIARYWQKEQKTPDQIEGWKTQPEPQRQAVGQSPRHERVRVVSVGLHKGEKPIGDPVTINWDELKSLVDTMREIDKPREQLAKPSPGSTARPAS